jgi:outer membrane lipoprotein SlyB
MKTILLLLVLAALAVTGCQKETNSNSGYNSTSTNSSVATTNAP